MFSGYDYVLMGHIHKPQIMSHNPYVAHVGSMDISNFGESDQDKKLILLDFTEEEPLTEIPIPTRKLNKIIISVPKDTKDTTQFVLDELDKYPFLKDSIVKLEVHLTSPELLPMQRSKIEESLYKKGTFNVSSLSESKKLAPIKKDGSSTDIDMASDMSSAIKKWAETQLDENKRELFIEVSNRLIKKFKNEDKE
jgi:DNA repair exonuclease SbcCD nuclease subunit